MAPFGSSENMDSSVASVEEILGYKFKNRKLLEEALTHPSHPSSPSFQRMEFVGDAVLGLALTKHVFLVYPNLPPGELSLLRSANVSTEKLARVAVHHGLHLYMRHNAASFNITIREFANAIENEGDKAVYGRTVKAPKVLADIVESIAAAVYIDVGFDQEKLWMIFRDLLEPIITLKDLQDEPQPVTLLFELCRKQGKQVNIKHWRNGAKSIASVYIDGNFIISASSEHKDIAKISAAKAALARFHDLDSVTREAVELCGADRKLETGGGMQKLSHLQGEKRRPQWIQDVEKIIDYPFKDWSLLEEALTYPSYTIGSNSYQRLEFLGDAALGLAFTNHFYLVYPTLDAGQLSLLRAANTSTEKFGRVAVRHGLYRYLRCSKSLLEGKVREFAEAVEEEDETNVYGGSLKSPKVLANIVEVVAAAVFVDVDFDPQKLWLIMRGMLEPIIVLKDLQSQPQPVTMLYELCQKQGKVVNFQFWYKDLMNIVASVFVDGKFIASSGSSKQKDIAKTNAAKAALTKLEATLEPLGDQWVTTVVCDWINGPFKIEGAKGKLQELCDKKKWSRPSYSSEKENGPPHERKYMCSVQLKPFNKDYSLCMIGDEKPRVKDSQNSAASLMIRALYSRNLL